MSRYPRRRTRNPVDTSDRDDDLTESENGSSDYDDLAPESRTLRAEFTAAELAQQKAMGNMKRGELVVRAMSGFIFTKNGRMWTPTPAAIKKSKWDGVLCTAIVASLSDDGTRPIVETGYWALEDYEVERFRMEVKPVQLYASRNLFFRQGELVMWLDTSSHSYALTCPDSSYEERWQDACSHTWWKGGGVAVFKDLKSTDKRPKWWPLERKALFRQIQVLIKQEEDQDGGDDDEEHKDGKMKEGEDIDEQITEDGEGNDEEDSEEESSEDGGEQEGTSEEDGDGSTPPRTRRRAAVEASKRIARASNKGKAVLGNNRISSDEEEPRPTSPIQKKKNAHRLSNEASSQPATSVSLDDSKDGTLSPSQPKMAQAVTGSPDIHANQATADTAMEGDSDKETPADSPSPPIGQVSEGSPALAPQASSTGTTPPRGNDDLVPDSPDKQSGERVMSTEAPVGTPPSPVEPEAQAPAATSELSANENTRGPSLSSPAEHEIGKGTDVPPPTTTEGVVASPNPTTAVQERSPPSHVGVSDPTRKRPLESPSAESRSGFPPMQDAPQPLMDESADDGPPLDGSADDSALARVRSLMPEVSYENPDDAGISTEQDLSSEFSVVGDLVAVFDGKVVFQVRTIGNIAQELGLPTPPWSQWHDAKSLAFVKQFLNQNLSPAMIEMLIGRDRVKGVLRMYSCAAFIPESSRGPLQKRLVTRVVHYVLTNRIEGEGRKLWIKIQERIRDWHLAFEADPNAAAKALPDFMTVFD